MLNKLFCVGLFFFQMNSSIAGISSCKNLFFEISETLYTGRKVRLMSEDRREVSDLHSGAILEITLLDDSVTKVVIANTIRYTPAHGHGDPTVEVEYPTIPIRIAKVTGQLIIDRSLHRAFKSIKYLGQMDPENFPPELSSFPGSKNNVLKSSYILEP